MSSMAISSRLPLPVVAVLQRKYRLAPAAMSRPVKVRRNRRLVQALPVDVVGESSLSAATLL
jgi:hypothetical protein